jgi:hypothetical protein
VKVASHSANVLLCRQSIRAGIARLIRISLWGDAEPIRLSRNLHQHSESNLEMEPTSLYSATLP